ncbi:MAG: hypothetical protein ACRBCS_09355 [Cellvibrionaceae bacterium]
MSVTSTLKIFGIIISFCGLTACLSDNSDSELIVVLNESFYHLDEYELADFTLSEDFEYWEVRKGETVDGNFIIESEEILYVYDDNAFANLSNQQVTDLDATFSANGFRASCEPDYCPFYGVAVMGNTTALIDSKSELLDFFEDIDTEAELHLWLWANDYKALSYELVPSGYLAVVRWSNGCDRRGEKIVYVDFDGDISTQRVIFVEKYNGPCV